MSAMSPLINLLALTGLFIFVFILFYQLWSQLCSTYLRNWYWKRNNDFETLCSHLLARSCSFDFHEIKIWTTFNHLFRISMIVFI